MIKESIIILLLAMSSISASSQGLTLFSPETKEAAPKPQEVVMDFLERYFTELKTLRETSVLTKMADDKVYFRKGKPSDLNQVCDTLPFSINLHDRYYEVSWTRQNEPFVTIVFPAQYDLLLGKLKDEALKTFKDVITSVSPNKVELKVPSEMETVDDNVFKSESDTLGLASLSDAVYYNKVSGNYLPVFDSNHLEYSAANLFHGLIANRDYCMYVEQSVYGMTTINYTISFSQWLNYCSEWGLKIFFAVEEQREDGILVLIIAQSKELGCHHLLSVDIPAKFVSDQNAVLKVRMTPYIPVQNVKDLFQKLSTTHKKVKWQ